ncbi:ureidoglycolate dehydrogenase [Corticicoccus populi]|uniref:Ureidoglycolate dehydrogenase n=1 Tax=Corticicoccus populi TaxID=1812821 RepID=A0ABW5X0J8_9STAP
MIDYNDLFKRTQYIFNKHGVEEDISETIADVLTHANLRGVDSHGVLRVSHYINRLRKGGINPSPDYDIQKTSSSTYTFDGDNGFGHHISKEAMKTAVTSAKNEGVGAVAVKNSSHCGALSYFVEQAANEDLIGIAMTHTDKIVTPYGSSEAFFGTNPIAFAFPAREENSVILDFATSTVALGKILDAKERGVSIPESWGVDKNGHPTESPDEVISLSPFGGPKGYGLAMVVEIFSALLTGAAFGPHVSKMYGDYDKNRELGHFFMAVDPSKFLPVEMFTSRLDQMIREIRNTAPAKGIEQVYVPGDIEMLTASKRKADGIPLPDSVMNFIMSESSEL